MSIAFLSIFYTSQTIFVTIFAAVAPLINSTLIPYSDKKVLALITLFPDFLPLFHLLLDPFFLLIPCFFLLRFSLLSYLAPLPPFPSLLGPPPSPLLSPGTRCTTLFFPLGNHFPSWYSFLLVLLPSLFLPSPQSLDSLLPCQCRLGPPSVLPRLSAGEEQKRVGRRRH